MKFKTQYDERPRFITKPGDSEHIIYTGHYDEAGRVVLEEVGRENIYDEIQSHAESVDINVLIKRYQNGDVAALERGQAMYLDVTNFPKTYAEALNKINDAKEFFLSLPLDTREKYNNSFTEFLAASNTQEFVDMFMPKPQAPVVEPDVVKKEEETE